MADNIRTEAVLYHQGKPLGRLRPAEPPPIEPPAFPIEVSGVCTTEFNHDHLAAAMGFDAPATHYRVLAEDEPRWIGYEFPPGATVHEIRIRLLRPPPIGGRGGKARRRRWLRRRASWPPGCSSASTGRTANAR